MRTTTICVLAGLATPAFADHITPPFLSTQVNPFGVPAVGTGIAIYVDTDGTQVVTAQQWKVEGHIVNHDAPGAAGVLGPTNPPPILQRQQETVFANLLDPLGAPWDANDSYWGNYFTAVLLGGGYNGSGIANPNGSAFTTMELVGGTTFGSTPAPSETAPLRRRNQRLPVPERTGNWRPT